jgi:hypothetical protein
MRTTSEQARSSSLPAGWPADSPPRSSVLDVAPEGICGGTYEDLLSIVQRTCAAYPMEPAALVRRVIAPLTVPPGGKWLQKGDKRYFSLVNGTGVVAERWSDALERLTLRNDLHLRTLLPLRGMVPSWNLLRGDELYCPECYREDEHLTRPRYHRLLWCIACVRACPLHRTLLRSGFACRQSGSFEHWRPGISQISGERLATRAATIAPRHMVETSTLVAELLDDIHEGPDIFELGSSAPRFLAHAAESLDGGLMAQQAKRLEMSEGKLRAWMAETNRPSLLELTQVARVFECSISDILLGNKILFRANTVPLNITPRPTNKRVQSVRDEDLSEKVLETLRSQECTDPADVAEGFGVSKRHLRKAAPEAYATLVEHCAEAGSERRFAEFMRSYKRLQQQGEYPTRLKVVADVLERTGIVIAHRDDFLAKAHQLSPPAKPRGRPPVAQLVKSKQPRHRKKDTG